MRSSSRRGSVLFVHTRVRGSGGVVLAQGVGGLSSGGGPMSSASCGGAVCVFGGLYAQGC